MRTSTPRLAALATSGLLVASLAGSASAASSPYHFSHLKVPHCEKSQPNGITPSGEIVGTDSCGKLDTGFLQMPDGTTTFFRGPGKHVSTDASNIASDGTVALVTTRGTRNRSWLRSPSGTYTKVSDPKAGRKGTVIEDVNAAGDTVGYYTTKSNHTVGYIERNGTFKNFSLPGARKKYFADLLTINDSGTMGGYFVRKSTYHAFVITGSKVTILHVPGAGTKANEGSYVSFVSDDGHVTGDLYYRPYTSKKPSIRSFIYDNGAFTTVSVPHSYGADTNIDGISATGEIVGSYVPRSALHKKDAFADERGYTATEVPTPADR